MIRAELERRGYSVELSCTYEPARLAFKQRRTPRLVLTSALYDDACLFGFVHILAGFCLKVVNLQWEQALTNSDESDPCFYQNPKGQALAAVHVCWGSAPRARLLGAGVSADRTKVVGPIHMDFVREAFRDFYLDKAAVSQRFGLDASRTWVLFVSSFTFVNMSEEQYATEVKHMGARLEEFLHLSIASKRVILEWIRQAAAAQPDALFIYRPHPSENCDESLADLLSACPNVRVIGDLSVKQWISVSDTVLTWYSTSAAEAYFMRKHCVILRPVEIPHEWDVSIFRGARFVSDFREFLTGLGADSAPSLDDGVIRDYFDVDETVPSYVRICDVLERMLKTPELDMPTPTRWARLHLEVERLRHRVFFLMKEFLARKNFRNWLPARSWVAARLENHCAVMTRLDRDRWKNQATDEEIAELMAKMRRIVNARQN